MKIYYLEVIPQGGQGKISAQKVAKLFRQFWWNLGKHPSHPKKLTCSYSGRGCQDVLQFSDFFVFRTETWAFEGKKWQKHPSKIETFSPEPSQKLYFKKILGHGIFLTCLDLRLHVYGYSHCFLATPHCGFPPPDVTNTSSTPQKMRTVLQCITCWRCFCGSRFRSSLSITSSFPHAMCEA